MEKRRLEHDNVRMSLELQTVRGENDNAHGVMQSAKESAEAAQNQIETLTVVHKESQKRCEALNVKVRDLEATLLKERNEVKTPAGLLPVGQDEREWWQRQREDDRVALSRERTGLEGLCREAEEEVLYLRSLLKK